jgi:hypothetical protein
MEHSGPLADKFALEEPGGRPLPVHPDALLLTIEAAFILGLSPRTLESLRMRGGGPPFIAVTPKAIRYRRRDLEAWISDRQRVSTADSGTTCPRNHHG